MYCAYKHQGNEGMQVLTLTYQTVPSWDHIIYAITYKYLHFMNKVFQRAPPAVPPHAGFGRSSGEEQGQITTYRASFMKDLDAGRSSRCWWVREVSPSRGGPESVWLWGSESPVLLEVKHRIPVRHHSMLKTGKSPGRKRVGKSLAGFSLHLWPQGWVTFFFMCWCWFV